MWHVASAPGPAAAGSTLPTASWTRATARCRGFYACYLVLCVNIELNYNPITSNAVQQLCFFFIIYLFIHCSSKAIYITGAPCGRDAPENGSKCCIAFFFFLPAAWLVFCSARQNCAWYVCYTANHSQLSFLCPQLCPLIPNCYAPSLTARNLEGKCRFCFPTHLSFFIRHLSPLSPAPKGHSSTKHFFFD